MADAPKYIVVVNVDDDEDGADAERLTTTYNNLIENPRIEATAISTALEVTTTIIIVATAIATKHYEVTADVTTVFFCRTLESSLTLTFYEDTFNGGEYVLNVIRIPNESNIDFKAGSSIIWVSRLFPISLLFCSHRR
uniref:Uncharacterized protein n=1 Tax=Vespula pensylvanica TaxID=30213 RepID=A0A834JZ39_VESPE|nr:hypothetical protein H0235_016871 [Vespula pensylvanica]